MLFQKIISIFYINLLILSLIVLPVNGADLFITSDDQMQRDLLLNNKWQQGFKKKFGHQPSRLDQLTREIQQAAAKTSAVEIQVRRAAKQVKIAMTIEQNAMGRPKLVPGDKSWNPAKRVPRKPASPTVIKQARQARIQAEKRLSRVHTVFERTMGNERKVRQKVQQGAQRNIPLAKAQVAAAVRTEARVIKAGASPKITRTATLNAQRNLASTEKVRDFVKMPGGKKLDQLRRAEHAATPGSPEAKAATRSRAAHEQAMNRAKLQRRQAQGTLKPSHSKAPATASPRSNPPASNPLTGKQFKKVSMKESVRDYANGSVRKTINAYVDKKGNIAAVGNIQDKGIKKYANDPKYQQVKFQQNPANGKIKEVQGVKGLNPEAKKNIAAAVRDKNRGIEQRMRSTQTSSPGFKPPTKSSGTPKPGVLNRAGQALKGVGQKIKNTAGTVGRAVANNAGKAVGFSGTVRNTIGVTDVAVTGGIGAAAVEAASYTATAAGTTSWGASALAWMSGAAEAVATAVTSAAAVTTAAVVATAAASTAAGYFIQETVQDYFDSGELKQMAEDGGLPYWTDADGINRTFDDEPIDDVSVYHENPLDKMSNDEVANLINTGVDDVFEDSEDMMTFDDSDRGVASEDLDIRESDKDISPEKEKTRQSIKDFINEILSENGDDSVFVGDPFTPPPKGMSDEEKAKYCRALSRAFKKGKASGKIPECIEFKSNDLEGCWLSDENCCADGKTSKDADGNCPCPGEEVRDPDTGKCDCPAWMHRNEDGECVEGLGLSDVPTIPLEPQEPVGGVGEDVYDPNKKYEGSILHSEEHQLPDLGNDDFIDLNMPNVNQGGMDNQVPQPGDVDLSTPNHIPSTSPGSDAPAANDGYIDLGGPPNAGSQ